MTTITDPRFIKKIFRDFCAQDIRGHSGRLFLSRCVIEVEFPRLAIVEYEHGEPFTPVSFVLHPIRGVESCRFHPFNKAVAECMREPYLNRVLDRALRRFLKIHNLLPTLQGRNVA